MNSGKDVSDLGLVIEAQITLCDRTMSDWIEETWS